MIWWLLTYFIKKELIEMKSWNADEMPNHKAGSLVSTEGASTPLAADQSNDLLHFGY